MDCQVQTLPPLRVWPGPSHLSVSWEPLTCLHRTNVSKRRAGGKGATAKRQWSGDLAFVTEYIGNLPPLDL